MGHAATFAAPPVFGCYQHQRDAIFRLALDTPPAICINFRAGTRRRVTTDNDVPVSGALVTVADIPFTRTWEGTSDPTGAFSLQLPAPGLLLAQGRPPGLLCLFGA